MKRWMCVRAGWIVAMTAVSLVGVACGSATGPDSGSVTLTVVSGDAQVGVQGATLSQPVVVRATDSDGAGVAGARLTLLPGSGSGRLLEADTVTDASGQASFRWQLGSAWENVVQVAAPEYTGATVVATATAHYAVTLPVRTDDGWEVAMPSELGMDEADLVSMMDSLRAGAYPETHSVVIIKDHKLALEAYFPGHDFGYNSPGYLGEMVDFDRNARHNTHSATKSFVSALVGLAIDGGFVASEDERVFDFFPDYSQFAVGGKETITIRDMLTMSSGLEWHEWDAALGSGQNSVEEFNAAGDRIGYVLSQDLVAAPGTVFNYSGGTVNVLCQLAGRATGEGVQALARTHLFEPMGVTNYNFSLYPSGMPACHGDVYITPRDMAKFGQLYLNGGTWHGERILSQEWVERSTTPTVSVRSFGLPWASNYGYLWWMQDYPVQEHTYSTYKALGWGGQEIWVLPEVDMVVVFTGANYSTNPPTDWLMRSYIFPSLQP